MGYLSPNGKLFLLQVSDILWTVKALRALGQQEKTGYALKLKRAAIHTAPLCPFGGLFLGPNTALRGWGGQTRPTILAQCGSTVTTTHSS